MAEARAAELNTLVIGMSTSPGRGLLPALRTRLISRHPRARPVLRQVNSAGATAGLADGSNDVASSGCRCRTATATDVWWLPGDPALWHDRRGNPLAARAAADSEGALDFTELLDEPFLALPSEAGPLRGYWLALDARGDRARRRGGVVGSAEETMRRSPTARAWRCCHRQRLAGRPGRSDRPASQRHLAKSSVDSRPSGRRVALGDGLPGRGGTVGSRHLLNRAAPVTLRAAVPVA